MREHTASDWQKACLIVCIVALPTLITFCGTSEPAPTYNISGTWDVSFNVTGQSPQEPSAFTFVQTENSLTGTTSQAQPFTTGDVSGVNISFSFPWTAEGSTYTYTFTGVIGSNGRTMLGTWSDNSGSQSGSWSATIIGGS